MLSPGGIASLALSTLLFTTTAIAKPQFFGSRSDRPHERRDDLPTGAGNTTVVSNETQAILDPVIPPDVNPDDLSILNLDHQATLTWAGTSADNTTSATPRLLRREGAVFTQANLTFNFPVIPLDHSSFVSGVSCTGGQLTATLSDKAYTYAKKLWSRADTLVFVTSADSCGVDSADDFFKASSVSFSDASKTFTASGASQPIQNVAKNMNLKWGDLGPRSVKRAIDKRDMFEPHPLNKRGRASIDLHWGAWLHSDSYLGTDHEAPWPFAAKLAEWGKTGGEEDDSWSKGEVADPDGHHKRWLNETSLTARGLEQRAAGELTYGLKLFCVECGFGGRATIWGEVDVDFSIIPPFFELSTVQVGLDVGMRAGLNIGLQAFVKYEKEWEKELGRIYLQNWGIPGIIDFGPFVSVSVSAKAGIEASGQLLLGAHVDWDGFAFTLDLLHPSQSHAESVEPSFGHNASAKGELKVSAGLGLPVMIGAGLRLAGGLWKAEAGVVDTPGVVLEGKFEISAEINDAGEIVPDVNDGCYGIAWNVHFENELDAVLRITGLDDYSKALVRPQESEPIAKGCIGYSKDGNEDSPGPQGSGSSTGTTGNGLNSGGNGLAGGFPGSSSGKKSTTVSSAKASPTVLAPAVMRLLAATPSTMLTVQATSKSTSTSGFVQAQANAGKGSSTTSSSSAKPSSMTTSILAPANAAKTTTRPATTTSKSSTTTTTSRISIATSAKSTCTASTTVITNTAAPTATPASVSCKTVVNTANVSTAAIQGTASTVASADLCAASCLRNAKCLSFSYSSKNVCQLYSKAYKNLGVTTKSGSPNLTFWDRICYVYNSCPAK